MKGLVRLVILILGAALFLLACGGEDSKNSGSMYACTYEKRSSQTCNHYDYGAWAAGCYSFDANNYYITPQEVCSNMTQGGLSCAASCCIDVEYRNVALNAGNCP